MAIPCLHSLFLVAYIHKCLAKHPVRNLVRSSWSIVSVAIPKALLYGDNRPFNVALIFPDWDLLTSWAQSKLGTSPEASREEIASLDAVRNLIEGEIQMSLDRFKKFEVGDETPGRVIEGARRMSAQ